MKRGGPLRPISVKRRGQMAERRRVETVVRARDRTCVAEKTWSEVACGGGLDVHEPNARSRNEGDWLDADRCVVICGNHHYAIHHRDPRRARELGLLR